MNYLYRLRNNGVYTKYSLGSEWFMQAYQFYFRGRVGIYAGSIS